MKVFVLHTLIGRYLLFHLQQQRLIEYIREGRVEEALEFATTHLAERGEEDNQVIVNSLAAKRRGRGQGREV